MTVINTGWFKSTLENVRNEIDVQTNLSQLKVALTTMNPGAVTQLAPSLQIDIIFDCLNSSDTEQIQTCCEILNVILPVIPVEKVFSQHEAALNRALNHPEKEVKEVVLLELIRSISDGTLIRTLHNSPLVLKNVISCLCDEELSVANHSIKLLTQLGKIPEGLSIICQPSIKPSLIEAISVSEVYRIRLYQVVIDISVDSYEALQKVEKEGFVDGLYQLLSSDDVLSRLALLEELTKLAVTEHGFHFIKLQKILGLMAEQLQSYEDDPLSSLITPGILKFFGRVGQKFPSELMSASPGVLKTILRAVLSDDLPIGISALEAVGFIATSTSGKATLNAQDKKLMKQVLEKMGQGMSKLSDDWRSRTVNAVVNILHLEDCSPGNELTQVTEMWFNQLGPNALEHLYELAQQPFPDLKIAALHAISKVSCHTWGQGKMKNCPGLMEFLLDRTTESSLEGMQSKFNIISNIVESPSGSEMFEELEYWRLQEYVKQGPCYAPALTEVAFEGQN